MIIASVIGALYACLMFFPNLKSLYSMLCKFAFSLVIIVTAFKTDKIILYIKAVLVFYLSSFLLGGITLAMMYLTNASYALGAVVKNGIFYFNIPWYILFASAFVSYILVKYAVSIYNTNKNMNYKRVEVYVGKKSTHLTCLVDTGNFLTDPITKEPVIIAELSAVKDVIPKNMYDMLNNGYDFESITSFEEIKIRIIPFSSLGNTNGMLIGFKPDYLIVNGKSLDKAVIGVYNNHLSANHDYNALIGANIEGF